MLTLFDSLLHGWGVCILLTAPAHPTVLSHRVSNTRLIHGVTLRWSHCLDVVMMMTLVTWYHPHHIAMACIAADSLSRVVSHKHGTKIVTSDNTFTMRTSTLIIIVTNILYSHTFFLQKLRPRPQYIFRYQMQRLWDYFWVRYDLLNAMVSDPI